MEIKLSDHFDYKKLWKFALPVISSLIVSSIFGAVDDGLFVSNYVGKNAFTAINIVVPFMWLLVSPSFMFGSGGSALIGKLFGEGKYEEGNKAFAIIIEIVFIISVIFALIGFIYMREISYILGATDELIEDCVLVGRFQMATLPFMMIWMANQSFLVVAEKQKSVFTITTIVSVINIGFDIIFIAIMKMGLIGSCIATGLGMVFAGVVSMYILMFDKKSLLKFKFTKLDFKPISISVSNGIATMINEISVNLLGILYNLKLMELYGEDGVVAYSIIMYINFIFTGCYMGYTTAIQPVISYNLGANNDTELKNVIIKSLKSLKLISIVLTALSILLAKPISAVFVSYDQIVWDLSIYAVRIFSLSFLIQDINIFVSGMFTALNDGKDASLITFPRTFIFQLITIYLLPYLFGKEGIWFSGLASELLAGTISVILFILRAKKYHYLSK